MEKAAAAVATKDALMKIHTIEDVAAICAAVEAINEAAVAAKVAPRVLTEVDTEILEVEVPLVRAPTTTITHLDATQASEQAEEQTQRMKTEVPLRTEALLETHLGSNYLSRDASGMAHVKEDNRRHSLSTLATCLSPSTGINLEAPSTSLVRCFTHR